MISFIYIIYKRIKTKAYPHEHSNRKCSTFGTDSEYHTSRGCVKMRDDAT